MQFQNPKYMLSMATLLPNKKFTGFVRNESRRYRRSRVGVQTPDPSLNTAIARELDVAPTVLSNRELCCRTHCWQLCSVTCRSLSTTAGWIPVSNACETATYWWPSPGGPYPPCPDLYNICEI